MSYVSYIFIIAAILLSIGISFSLTPAFIKLAKRVGMIDTPRDGRRMHNHPVPLLGGLSIIAGFLITAFVMAILLWAINDNGRLMHLLVQILPGALIIAVTSLIDDKYDLPALPRLLIQCVAAGITVAMGVKITFVSGDVGLLHASTYDLGWLSIPITIIWIVGITNAVNWIDGLDGLAAGVSSISAFSMVLIAVFQPQNQTLSIAILAASLGGSCIGLLPFNRHPAKIFMGDTGSMFLGFTLAVVSIQGMLKIYASISFLVPLMLLALPLLDSVTAIIRRVYKGVSPAEPDRSHIHHKLVDMGLTQKQAVHLLYFLSSVLGLLGVLFSIFSKSVGWRFVITSILVVIILFYVVIYAMRLRSKSQQKKEISSDSPAVSEAASLEESADSLGEQAENLKEETLSEDNDRLA